MATLKKELKAKVDQMTEALDTAGDALANVREKLGELKGEIGDAEFQRQQQLKDPSPEFLKYVSVEVWADTLDGLIQQFGAYEQKIRNDIRTKSVEALQSIQSAFYEILDGLTSLMHEYGQRLWAMVMKNARALMSAASRLWQIIKENPGGLGAFLFGASVGGAAAVHAGVFAGGVSAAAGGVALVSGLAAGLLAVGVFYACTCAYRYCSGHIEEYRALKDDVERLKESVGKISICGALSADLRKAREDLFRKMDEYESKFLQGDDDDDAP